MAACVRCDSASRHSVSSLEAVKGGRHQQALAAPSVGSDGLCAVGEDDFGEGGEVMRSEHGSCGHSGLLTSCVGLGPPLPPTFR